MMGFPEKKAISALKKCDNNAERALDWIMSHMDDPGSEEEDKDGDSQMHAEDLNKAYECGKPGKYNL